MKNFFMLLCVAMIAASSAFSQTFGIKAGLNSTVVGVSSDDLLLDDQDGRLAFQIGAIAMLELTDMIELRTGANYTQKGTGWKDYLDSGEDIVFALDYLEIPIDIAFRLGDDGLALNAGPYFGFLMNSEMKSDSESNDVEDVTEMDYGLNFGVSYLLNESILIDVRYGMGLSNLIDEDDIDEAAVNGALQLSIAYMFGDRY